MSELLRGGEQEPSSRGSDWSTLAALANKNISDTKGEPVRGSSERFKKEAAEHEANAEMIMDNMSDAQLEALAQEGIRDARDAGEFLHEAALWKEQVGRQARSLDRSVDIYERQLIEFGEDKGLDPVTGARLEGEHESWSDDGAREWAEYLQSEQEKGVWSNDMVTWAMGDLIRDESRAKKEQGADDGLSEVVLPGEASDYTGMQRPRNPKPHSKGALVAEGIEQWKADVLSDEAKKEEVENSVYYKTLTRKMQKEVEMRKEMERQKEVEMQKGAEEPEGAGEPTVEEKKRFGSGVLRALSGFKTGTGK